MFQTEIPNLLPVINEILARVNRQMLLILKTNDLLRGIESTLQTQSRLVFSWLSFENFGYMLLSMYQFIATSLYNGSKHMKYKLFTPHHLKGFS